jgi:DNA-directed RNA polymerase specialized sigma54-like protein
MIELPKVGAQKANESHSSRDLATLTISEHVQKVRRSFATTRECLEINSAVQRSPGNTAI